MSACGKLKLSTPKISFPVGKDGLAVYASRSEESRGRLYSEVPSKTRCDFERDRDRIIHSAAFRRLKFKTQVFVSHEGDNYRTRLLHSIEVAQVARSLARLLRANEDLVETCALAHDFGHTPFAHSGEDALNECMEPYGGFNHNDQTLRVVTLLEKKYPNFDGLNLTWESLEGLVKHDALLCKKSGKTGFGTTLDVLSEEMDLMLDVFPSVEAQIAGLADDIAYNSHDLDDGLAAGLFTLNDLKEVLWVDRIIVEKSREHKGIGEKLLAQEVVREVMGSYVLDALAESKCRIIELNPACADDIRNANSMSVSMSGGMEKKDKELREFLREHFYQHSHLNRARLKTFKIVQDLFSTFMENSRCLPKEWQKQVENVPKGWKSDVWCARSVADYIASMTDRRAILEHGDLFDTYQVIR
ncbi:MAG: deoxyguanosinetriphosphate triphosphohydrolase [Alphaproteobacteria bacterium]|nr:deoxyguanosinetriphosphate triphosphohydrolase [Alphaproteobacteria bacterium]MCK5555792.1 deoxyguanosinetriphosphate triphosphohydrolase [Alphaproteobacteria bacterium]